MEHPRAGPLTASRRSSLSFAASDLRLGCPSLGRIPTLRAHEALTTLFRLSESGLALEWPPKSIRELFAGHIGRYLQDTMVASFEGTPADQFDRRAPTESGPCGQCFGCSLE
jgi:hypothetical protein